MNLTTPAVAITPRANGQDPTAVAADLRAIADVIENDAHLATMIAQIFTSSLWPLHAVEWDQRDDPRGVMAETIRRFKPIASGPVEKQYEDDIFYAIVPLKTLQLRLTDMRKQVCTRVVTGVEIVTEEVPDPDYIANAPTVTQTREVEQVEWRCEPLMSSK